MNSSRGTSPAALRHPGSVTAAVRDIPGEWREQAGDGAVVLAPFNTLFAGGGLLKLKVERAVATGRFVGTASYMWVRGHRPHHRLDPPDTARREASVIDPDEVWGGGWSTCFVLGLLLPDVAFAHRGEGEERQAQLWDEEGTSVALVNHGEGGSREPSRSTESGTCGPNSSGPTPHGGSRDSRTTSGSA